MARRRGKERKKAIMTEEKQKKGKMEKGRERKQYWGKKNIKEKKRGKKTVESGDKRPVTVLRTFFSKYYRHKN